MRPAPFRPAVQAFVCTNRRDAGDPLGPGCGDAGEAVWRELRGRVAGAGIGGRVWVTRTLCQGLCPRSGACVSLSPAGELWTDVSPADVAELAARLGVR
jgi:(2Fe-2S) ferredoxin